jgi:hypothetical protein
VRSSWISSYRFLFVWTLGTLFVMMMVVVPFWRMRWRTTCCIVWWSVTCRRRRRRRHRCWLFVRTSGWWHLVTVTVQQRRPKVELSFHSKQFHGCLRHCSISESKIINLKFWVKCEHKFMVIVNMWENIDWASMLHIFILNFANQHSLVTFTFAYIASKEI